ncbi:hypothetical protein ACBJ59_37710 [Nonomuraea sp. MTCD27]|uniref:hypothetical protein n=1 Tax=Nonomuraea sp. MTCD27 TaxID=1676747 RepID=UPI0035BEB90E
MLALSLGMAWLLLAPLSLWLLVKGTKVERAGAIVTLCLLEGGTIAMNAIPHPAAPVHPAAAAHSVPAPPLPCQERAPVPQSASAGQELVLTWPAAPRECPTAEVIIRVEGRKLLVWLYETPRAEEHRAMLTMRHRAVFTLPVHVQDGIATLKVPLDEKTGYIPTDGRSGRPIPRPAA